MGKIREIGYQHLPLGAYNTPAHPETEDEEFNHILHEFEASIAAFQGKGTRPSTTGFWHPDCDARAAESQADHLGDQLAQPRRSRG